MRTKQRAVVAALSMLLLGVGCTTTSGGGSALDTWDLTDGHAPADVGWDGDLTAMEAEPGEVRLPGGVVLTGIDRANASREGDRLTALSVTFPSEPVDAVLARARTLAVPLDLDIDAIDSWAAANGAGQDTSPGGATATTPSTRLDDATTLALSTRAFPDGDALLRVEVFWAS